MKSTIRCYICMISGMLLGFQIAEDEEYNFLIVDLLIIELLFEWDK